MIEFDLKKVLDKGLIRLRLSFSPRICGFNPQEIMGVCKKFEL
jgi:hypothetical protein